MRLYDLLEKDGWANHYNCDMTDGECNKRIAERESAEDIEKTIREQIAREIEERIIERGENEPWDKDINVGLKEAASIARGE